MYDLDNPKWAADTSWRYALVQLEGLSPYRFCKSHHTRDVKSANVLLDEKFMAKVSELGLPKTGPYLDQTYVSLAVKGSFGYVLDQVPITEEIWCLLSLFAVILKVLCRTLLIDPYISRKWIDQMCEKVGEESKDRRDHRPVSWLEIKAWRD